jgi:hypothetical protein
MQRAGCGEPLRPAGPASAKLISVISDIIDRQCTVMACGKEIRHSPLDSSWSLAHATVITLKKRPTSDNT